MYEELKTCLLDYKEKTLKAIALVEKDDLDALEKILDSRQNIIEHMENLNYTQDEFIGFCKEFDIMPLQKRLTEIMNRKKLEYRKEMDNLNEIKTANKSYNKRFAVDSIYFNKKI